MPTAVWSHNTTVYRAMNFTPFQLMYGAEAMLPEEIKHRSLRTTTDIVSCPNEVEEKDLLELDKPKVVANLENTRSRQEHGETRRSNHENSTWEIWYFCEAHRLRAQESLKPNRQECTW
jgi:hypothetical protein